MTNDPVIVTLIAYELQDANEMLSEIIELFRPNIEIDEDEFNWRMAHLYSHLNTAWNIRNINGKEYEETGDAEQRNLWQQFPKDLKPM